MRDETVTYRAIRNSLSTFDIILLKGVGIESDLIKMVELSPWTHVAMVIRIADCDLPLIWESTPLKFIDDVLLHTTKSGARIVSLDDRLRIAVEKQFYDKFALRKLEVERTPAMLAALRDYIERVHCLSFPTPWELAKDYVKGRFLDEQTNSDHIYCAELVAETYMHLGLLAVDHPPNRYSPKDFSSEVRLPLLRGARLLDEIIFSVESGSAN